MCDCEINELINNLYFAIRNNHPSMACAFLHNQRLPQNFESHRLLKTCLRLKKPGLFYKLLKHGAAVTGFDTPNRNTLLHYAVHLNDVKIAETLLKYRVDVNATDRNRETPIHLAAKKYTFDILHMILKYAIENKLLRKNLVDNDGISILHILAMGPNSSYVMTFLQDLKNKKEALERTTSSDLNNWPGFTAIHFAAAHYRFQTVKILSDHGARLDSKTSADGLTLLHLVCRMEEIQWMLHEAMPNGFLGLSEKKRLEQLNEHYRIVLIARVSIIFLLAYYNKLEVDARDFEGNNALMHLAAHELSSCEINYLINRSGFDNAGIDASIRCLHSFHVSLAELLFKLYPEYDDVKTALENSIDSPFIKKVLNYRNGLGRTCLHELADMKSGNFMLANVFSKYCENLNIFDYNYQTIMHHAAKNNNCQFLINIIRNDERKIINIDRQDELGNTALHYACMNQIDEHLLNDSFCVLLKHGANVFIENNEGISVMSLVSSRISRMIENEYYLIFLNQIYEDTVDFKNKPDAGITSEIYEEEFREYKINIRLIAAFWNYFVKLEISDPSLKNVDQDFSRYLRRNLDNSEKSIAHRDECVIECEKEIELLKRKRINNFATLYDVLVNNVDRVSKYTKNEELQNIITSPDLEKQYPLYSWTLTARYARAKERCDLIEEATDYLQEFVNNTIPLACIENICSYFNQVELRDFVIVCKMIESDDEENNLYQKIIEELS